MSILAYYYYYYILQLAHELAFRFVSYISLFVFHYVMTPFYATVIVY